MAARPPDDTLDFEDFYASVLPCVVQAVRRLGGGADAEDIAQEALVRVWARWEQVGPSESPAGYAFTVARNLWRRRMREVLPLDEARETHDPSDHLGAVDVAQLLLTTFTTLSRQQRSVLLLIDAAGYDTAEVAERLGITPSTVRVHLARARANARARLADTG